MRNIISLKEFRQDVAQYAERANKGESFVVVRRSRPFFRIEAVQSDEDGWETVIDFTKFRKGGMPASELIKILESL